MKVLVTGGTGLLGNNIIRSLLDRGHQVKALVRDPSLTRPFDGLDVELATGDITDFDSIQHSFQGVDSVIHSAGFVHIGWRKLEKSRQINVIGTENIAKSAKDRNLRMVHISSVDTLGVDGKNVLDENSPVGDKIFCSYVVSKTEAEQSLQNQIENGLDAVVVHPGLMLGPYDWKPSSGKMFLAVGKTFTPVAPTGGGCVVDVRDASVGTILALEKGRAGRHYILGGENITYRQLWIKMAEVANSGKPFLPLGPLMRILATGALNTFTAISGKESDVNSAAIQMGTQHHYYSSQRAIDELGYQWRPLDQSLEDAWRWLCKENIGG